MQLCLSEKRIDKYEMKLVNILILKYYEVINVTRIH